MQEASNQDEHLDCDLREKQHTELLALVSDIQSKSSESIQELIRESDRILGKREQSWMLGVRT